MTRCCGSGARDASPARWSGASCWSAGRWPRSAAGALLAGPLAGAVLALGAPVGVSRALRARRLRATGGRSSAMRRAIAIAIADGLSAGGLAARRAGRRAAHARRAPAARAAARGRRARGRAADRRARSRVAAALHVAGGRRDRRGGAPPAALGRRTSAPCCGDSRAPSRTSRGSPTRCAWPPRRRASPGCSSCCCRWAAALLAELASPGLVAGVAGSAPDGVAARPRGRAAGRRGGPDPAAGSGARVIVEALAFGAAAAGAAAAVELRPAARGARARRSGSLRPGRSRLLPRRSAAPADLDRRLAEAGRPGGIGAARPAGGEGGRGARRGAGGDRRRRRVAPGRLALLAAVAAPALGFLAPDLWLAGAGTSAWREVRRDMPALLDLLGVAVDGGPLAARARSPRSGAARARRSRARGEGSAAQVAVGMPLAEALEVHRRELPHAGGRGVHGRARRARPATAPHFPTPSRAGARRAAGPPAGGSGGGGAGRARRCSWSSRCCSCRR